MKKRILALLLALTLLVLDGCTVRDMVQVVGVSTTTLQELADAALSDETEAPESGDQFVTAESPAETPAEAPQDEAAPADEVSGTADTVGEHTYYYDVDHVVLYLDTYGHLPENYITKDEARALGWEGGILTIIGYSINDTIVIFDRIRENQRLHFKRGGDLNELANRSIYQTLTRSLYTVFTVLFTTFALYFFGGDTTKDFSFALLIGFFSGSYSSIFVASPLWVVLKNRFPAKKI